MQPQQPEPCPRCKSARLAVLYYDADGKPVGGHVHCSECGSRHNVTLSTKDARAELLQRKAS